MRRAGLRVRPARPADAAELAPRLRAADLEEIAALTAADPESVLTRCVSSSDQAYAAELETPRTVALFGVVPDSRHRRAGQIWMVGSRDMHTRPVTVARASREWVERLQSHYAVLWNCIDARNRTSLRWLQWCGFRIVQRWEEYGAEGRPFYEFRREAGVPHSWRGPGLARLDP